MSSLPKLRQAAREIFQETLQAVNPYDALRRELRFDPSRALTFSNTEFELRADTQIFSIAIGKAALPMAAALESILGDKLTRGVIASSVLKCGSFRLSDRWESFQAGHPLPNESSLAAAQAAFALIDEANSVDALIVFMVSGGGSASIEWPIDDDISLADLRAANQTLVGCGASINEINAVRRVFSAIKGGRLAARATRCRQLTLIVSDVPRGDEYNVASGPTISPAAGGFEPQEVIRRYNLEQRLPVAILSAIKNRHSLPALPENKSEVLLDNERALKAATEAADARGFSAAYASDVIDGPIEIGCEKLIADLAEIAAFKASQACLISGGEFECPVRGEGLGGRNLETALRLALAAEKHSDKVGEFVALCAGTDGIDGNSPAAGAIVDSTTIQRARAIGLDPIDFLRRSDAYSFFAALGDVIATGPTGTNVRDLRILITAQD